MSKVDAQRAMKAARHARIPALAAPAPARPAPARVDGSADASVRAPAPGQPAPELASGPVAAPAHADAAAGTSTLCGHRSMAGKECHRPTGHPEKSHRYT